MPPHYIATAKNGFAHICPEIQNNRTQSADVNGNIKGLSLIGQIGQVR
jgi:hypothetical protein